MLTIPTASMDRLYDQWLEHAEAVFTHNLPVDSAGPLQALDGPERRTAQQTQGLAHWLLQRRAHDEAHLGSAL